MRPSTEEAVIFRVEENGSETCEVSPNSSFVVVRVPVRIVGDGEKAEATSQYTISSFSGRETTLSLRAGLQTTLRFRVPLELFQARERLTLEVRSGSAAGAEILWVKRYSVVWQGKTPSLEPVAE